MSVEVRSPATLDEALNDLAALGPRTCVLAGGTDLMVEFETGRTQAERVLDIWNVDALRGIRVEEDGLTVGALTTCAELLRSEAARQHADILVDAADEVGAEQIKNRATVGGNLGTASPAADLNPVLAALDARVRLVSAGGRRELAVSEFLTGYRETLRRPDELIEAVVVPPRAEGERRRFRKVGTRAAQSISKVVVALAVEVADGRVRAARAAAGSVAPRTVLLERFAALLVGAPLDEATLTRAARAAAEEDVAPVDDVRSSARYRRHALQRVLTSLLRDMVQ